ncbi:MAG: serine protease [Acidimicrobiales bacterium]
MATLLIGSLIASVVPAPNADASPPAGGWAPAATATIHPGVMMFTDGAQCTANFIFTRGTDVYIGYAAHCAGTGAATDTDGCLAGSLPLGTPVEIDGASQDGTLVYSSWLAMQAAHESDANTCAYNDLALVRLAPADVSKVNPSIPHWGGPTGLNTTGNPLGSTLYTYGNSSLRLGITQLSPKKGVSLGTSGGGWTHPAYTVTPGIPGDSGSALLDASGRASGVLSTVSVAPLPASNNFGDLSRELAYAQSHGQSGVALENGTEAFNPNALPLGI